MLFSMEIGAQEREANRAVSKQASVSTTRSKLGAILARYRQLMYSYVDHRDGCHPHFYWLIRGGRIRLDPVFELQNDRRP